MKRFFSIFANGTATEKLGTAITLAIGALTVAIPFLTNVREQLCTVAAYLGIPVECVPLP